MKKGCRHCYWTGYQYRPIGEDRLVKVRHGCW